MRLSFGLPGGLQLTLVPRADTRDYAWILGTFGVIGQAAAILGAAYIVCIASDALSVARELDILKIGPDP